MQNGFIIDKKLFETIKDPECKYKGGLDDVLGDLGKRFSRKVKAKAEAK